MSCAHCGKPFTTSNPAYLGLLLHKICYQAVGGCIDDLHPREPRRDTSHEQAMAEQEKDDREQKRGAFAAPADLPGQRGTHGCQYPEAPAPLDASEMGLNEVLIRLGFRRSVPEQFWDTVELHKDGKVVFTGRVQMVWSWLREQKFIL